MLGASGWGRGARDSTLEGRASAPWELQPDSESKVVLKLGPGINLSRIPGMLKGCQDLPLPVSALPT